MEDLGAATPTTPPQTLEELVARLNTLAFFREFSFSKNKFFPKPGQEVEFADSVVWLGNHLTVLQLKERDQREASDAEAEKKWFEAKVIRKASKQIRDSLRFLSENKKIKLKNERDHEFEIISSEMETILKIIVYLPSSNLPNDYRAVKGYRSETAGFIHIIDAIDYLNVLDVLRVPADIREYFAYRESLFSMHGKMLSSSYSEQMIVGQFLHGNTDTLPNAESLDYLRALSIHEDDFDLSGLIENLHDHIERHVNPYDYYEIMLEFAKAPRSLWREIKMRFMRCMDTVSKGEFVLPYRLSFPATNCAFMLCPVSPDIVADPRWGPELRMRAIQNLSHAAKYDMKTLRCVGVSIAKEGEHFLLDWCLLNFPWEYDAEMERLLSESFPFRKAREKNIQRFFPGT